MSIKDPNYAFIPPPTVEALRYIMQQLRSTAAASMSAHALVGASHTATGLTPGHFLKATAATTFGFAAHGLTYSDVGAAAVGNGVTNGDAHDHVGGDGAQIDHGGLGGLDHDDHPGCAWLAGRTTGQVLYGGTATNATLTLYGSSAAGYCGYILLNPVTTLAARVGIGTPTPASRFHVMVSQGGHQPGARVECNTAGVSDPGSIQFELKHVNAKLTLFAHNNLGSFANCAEISADGNTPILYIGTYKTTGTSGIKLYTAGLVTAPQWYFTKTGEFACGGNFTPTAKLHLAAGVAATGGSPFKFTSGPLLSAPEAGAVEFLTDKWYGTITTGAARTEVALCDAALTLGRIPFVTTNGRLKDDTTLLYDGSYLRAPGYKSSDGSAGITGTQVVVVDVTQDAGTKDITVTKATVTYKNGLITGIA